MFLYSGFLCSKLTTFPFFFYHTLTGYFTTMSWMDSWSRASKHAASPPPLYLLSGVQSTLYCHTPHGCTGPHRSNTKASVTSPVKYCSALSETQTGKIRLSNRKHICLVTQGVRPSPSVYINAEEGKEIKGNLRILVSCTIEAAVFGDPHDPEKNFGRKRNKGKARYY